LREAGFAAVDIEWLHPQLTDGGARTLLGEKARRLSELLFTPQGYILAATR
jgi:hypothetical protein